MTSIDVNVDSGVMVVTLNRPDVLNAMRLQEFDALRSAIEEFRTQEETRALILTGRGRAFCSGEDLKVMAGQTSSRLTDLKEQLVLLQELTRLVYESDKPTIAAVNGPAIGFGAEIALAFDLRLMSDDAYFHFHEISQGMLATNAAFYFLPRMVGMSRAREILLCGDKIPAEDAVNIGLSLETMSSTVLPARARDLAHRLAGYSSLGMSLAKSLLRQSLDSDMDAIMSLEIDGTMRLAERGESFEAAIAFVESRGKIKTG